VVSELMSNEIALLAIFLLSVFVGFEVVSKVSTTLHTPLMAIAAVILATINMVGGFVVTDRMLQMFKGKPKQKKDAGEDK